VQPVLQVKELSKVYRDGTEAVKSISFAVRKGEIFGLLGPNGAGKTTAMRILGTLHQATSGHAQVLGIDVHKRPEAIRRRIGFAMQEVGMDDLATAREMLVLHARLYGLSKRDAQRRAKDMLELFDLAAHADRRVVRFSGGMQRRLDLAVSMIHGPEVLFLDEPSTGLDPTSRADLWAVLRRVRDEQGVTVLMSTHYMDEADALCDRIAIMNRGEIAAIDAPEALRHSVGQDRILVTLAAAPNKSQERALRKEFKDALELEDAQLRISTKDGAANLMPALQCIAAIGLTITSTRVKVPTLDDVFVHYTGEKLERPNGPDAGDAPGDKANGPGAVKAAKGAAPPDGTAGASKTPARTGRLRRRS
jgi:ABC-2 type transport system ATP-binding protein